MPSLQVYGRVKKFVLRHCPSTGKLISIHSILGSPTPPPPPRSSFDCQSRRRGSFSPLCASRIHPVAGREERRGVPSDSRRTHEHARTSTHALRELPSCSASSRGRTPSRRSVGESPASHDASRSPSTSSSARQRAKLDRRFFSRQALTVRAAACVG